MGRNPLNRWPDDDHDKPLFDLLMRRPELEDLPLVGPLLYDGWRAA